MATKTLYAIKTMRDPLYRTRQLTAGQPIQLSAPDARLYLHLGVVTAEKPKAARPAPLPGDTVTVRQPDGSALSGTVGASVTATLKPKAPRKRKAKK